VVDEKRSARGDWQQLDWLGGLAEPVHTPEAPHVGAHRGGVGGRQGPRPVRRGGGGYLNGRTPSELRSDPRLRELAEIGLAAHWLAVAEIAGYEAFLAIWRSLSLNPALRDDDNQIELRLRPFRAFERYQRNRYIETMVSAGLTHRQIHESIVRDLGERLSYRQTKRLAIEARARLKDEPEAPPHQSPAQAVDTLPR
jgi:hypothetical protein